MPMTPEKALMQCPAAKLNDQEREVLDSVKQHLDHHMADLWDGGPFGMKTVPCSTRVIAATMRAYEQHGWQVMAQPLDSELGIKASEILDRGGDPAWMITLKPVWNSHRKDS